MSEDEFTDWLVGLKAICSVAQWGKRLESWLVEEMGHHWPGGLGRINRRMAGPPSWRLDANDLIADFTNRTVSEQNNPDQILDFTNPSRWQPIPSRHPIAKA